MNGLKMPSAEPAFLVVIVGPTAVGKTQTAIQIAQLIDGEIISADSRLLYRGMDIGTAKPTLQERQNVPHYLIDVADPDEVWSVARYQQEVLSLIDRISARGKQPILVGGTGQFIRAILQGWQIPPQEASFTMRKAIETWATEIGARELHHKLQMIDPDAAALIEPNNLRRSVRAFEVIFSSGQRFSSLRQKRAPHFRYCIIGLTRPRSELYARVDARIKEMLSQGFLNEVRSLLSKNYSPSLPSLSAIGYKEMIGVINGEITLDEAETLMKRNTRKFIRRQANWFKPTDPEITWFDLSKVDIGTIVMHIQKVKSLLNQ